MDAVFPSFSALLARLGQRGGDRAPAPRHTNSVASRHYKNLMQIFEFDAAAGPTLRH
jgi:hypothetical protein